MAALYLHNAVFTPEPSELSRTPRPHSRNISIVSSLTTSQTHASEHSHPAEPLLHPATPDSLAYIDLISRHPTLVDERSPLDWTPGLSLFGDPPTLQEKKNSWEKAIRRRLKRLRLIMRMLEFIFAGWTIYNTVRYFIAFTTYDSNEGQYVSLALGTCAGISFAFLATASIFNFFKLQLIMHSVPLSYLTLTITISLGLSSLTLVVPAIVNMVILFVWRRRSNQELSVMRRCHIDVDVIWSGTKQTCPNPYTWGTWLALSATRLGVTVMLIVLYYGILITYERTRRPTRWASQKRIHWHRRTDSGQSALPPPSPRNSTNHPDDPAFLHQPSRSTVVSNSPSKKSTLRPSPSAASTDVSDSTNTLRVSPVETSASAERETLGFVDRFRSLVSQITRETDDAIIQARSYHDSDSDSEHSLQEHAYDLTPPIPPSIGYNEFGQPYPPEESIVILNGLIRRMPTIESMGSREVASTTNRASSLYSGSMLDRILGSNSSRPPTRNTYSRTDYTGSEPPSRPASMSTRPADMPTSAPGSGSSCNGVGNASEVGELLRMSEKRGSPTSASPRSLTFNLGVPPPNTTQGGGSHSSRASTTTTAHSYYTATMGSASSVPPSGTERS